MTISSFNADRLDDAYLANAAGPEAPGGRALTLFDKVWERHRVTDLPGGASLLYIDRHLINEVTSPQAFEGLRLSGRKPRRPERALAVADHNVPTADRERIDDPESREQLAALERNAAAFSVPYIPMHDGRQGIVHVVAPELGLTLPGMTIVCGDSHTSTHGAFGALAFGIGTSEVEHVLATQTLVQRRPRTMQVWIGGRLSAGLSAKDLTLHVMRTLGVSGGTGHVIEYAGPAVEALDMAGRMTLCNMSIEAGARAGMIAPDDTTFAYLEGRPHVPRGELFEAATARWRCLHSDPGAPFDRTVKIDAGEAEPLVTWGTTPATAWPLSAPIPDPAAVADPALRAEAEAALAYMGLTPGQTLAGLPVDAVFIGSCTNGRLEDLRAAAAVVRGHRVAEGVRALVVPGSSTVKAAAEAEGLHRIFLDAGLEWRESGCSMCLGMNADRLRPGERCASTSNRNFQGRQGPGGRTHLMSPAMAAAAAVAGRIVHPSEIA